jgi:hypothetical protein
MPGRSGWIRHARQNADMTNAVSREIAAQAARWVVEEGLEYGPAKRRALRELGLPPRTALPDNDLVEDEVVDYIAVFCAETQAVELLALRRLARTWMRRLAAFRPYLVGAAWHGTATRRSDIHLQLFCDDPKSAEIFLINEGVRYDVNETHDVRGEAVPVLSLQVLSPELQERVGLHLAIHDLDDLRGGLRVDSKGRTPRGSLEAVDLLLKEDDK